jgi:6-phosphogluconate dehydrogenase
MMPLLTGRGSVTESRCDIGMIGLGVMGSNLVLNMADRGLFVGAFNRTASVTEEFVSRLQPGQQVRAAYSLEELLACLARPRRIMLMVNAGKAVDAVISELEPLLRSDDILIDGGNSHYLDTDRRAAALKAKGVHFLGVGISGGESGARHGPSMMPGGPPAAYEAVRPIFESVAARVDGRPCVAYLGPGSAGHYVKMVHNGIEYAFMQLIAESYALLKQALAVDNDQLADLFAEWQGAELGSYLVEITAEIFRRRDAETGGPLVDLILGEAGQKGTGMWTSQSAMDLHVPIPNIDIAVSARSLSALVEEREAARQAFASEGLLAAAAPRGTGTQLSVDKVRAALYAAMVMSYCQGFAQLSRASETYGYGLTLREVASIWRGGCIIRSTLLGHISAAFELRPSLRNLLLDPDLGRAVSARRADLAEAVSAGVAARIPIPGLAAALSYFDGYVAAWSPTNLIQAQRDFFGAHTYRRTDREGVFHTDWSLEPN